MSRFEEAVLKVLAANDGQPIVSFERRYWELKWELAKHYLIG